MWKVITTGFSTRCCTSARLDWAAWLLALVVWLGLVTPVQADSAAAEITQMRVERSDEGLLLWAQVSFELPAAVDDALAKGIPMFFVAEATLLRERWYWTDKRVFTATRHMRLAFQPLTRRWRLQVSPTPIGNAGGLTLGQTFDTRDEALAAVRHISHWKIAEPGEVDPDARHFVDLRFRLDISQLPRPFQIGAVGQADWTISAARVLRVGDAAK